MLNRYFFKRAAILLLVVAVLNWMGLVFYLHWTSWWFDMVLHFLGGICVGLALISLRIINQLGRSKIARNTLIGVFIVGFLWEIFELILGGTSFSDGSQYWIDTISDLILDTSGGAFAILYSFKILKNE